MTQPQTLRVPKSVSDESKPDDEIRDDGFYRIEQRLTAVQSDVASIRDDVLALHAALADIQRRLRLIAGF